MFGILACALLNKSLIKKGILHLMTEKIPVGFNALSDKMVEYHTYIITLLSGIVIGFLTNCIVAFMIPLPYWYGLAIGLTLLVFSAYLFLLYSPNVLVGAAE
jgi:hypothetical protein